MSNAKIVKRVKYNKSDKEKCYICNKYEYITELHHLVTISDINSILSEIKEQEANLDSCYSKLNEIVEGIYLCPNHHTLYHKLLSKEYIQIVLILSSEERERYLNCFEKAKDIYVKIINVLKNYNLRNGVLRNIIKQKNKIQQTIYILNKI